jgi:hypothetical protein
MSESIQIGVQTKTMSAIEFAMQQLNISKERVIKALQENYASIVQSFPNIDTLPDSPLTYVVKRVLEPEQIDIEFIAKRLNLETNLFKESWVEDDQLWICYGSNIEEGVAVCGNTPENVTIEFFVDFKQRAIDENKPILIGHNSYKYYGKNASSLN